MALNADLLLAVREQITANPETHEQGTWGRKNECGTTHCIAGWACVLEGVQIRWTEHGEELAAMGGTNEVAANGTCWAIPGYAANALGLDGLQSAALFYETDNGKALAYLDRLIEEAKNQ